MTTQYRVPVLESFAWQPPVQGVQSAPPVLPAEGDRFIVKPTGSGAFATHDNTIAWYEGAAWHFDTPANGWSAYNTGNSIRYNFNGSAWVVEDDISGKADKVSGATNGDVAGLNASGNLTDTGITAANVSDAVSKKHTQGTDQALDTGGANEITAAHAKEAYDREASYDSVLKVLKFTI